MADVYNPIAAKFVLRGRLMGQSYQTVGYARLASAEAWTQEAIQGLADKVRAFWELDLRVHVSAQLIIDQVDVRQMAQNEPLIATAFSGVPGGATGDPLPGNVALVVRASTGRGGRGSSGRIYQGGLTETQVSGNVVSASVAEAIGNAWNSLIVRLSETGPVPMVPVVYSRFQNNLPRTTALLRPIVSYGVPDNVVDSQRRRLPGRGT